MRPDTCTVAIVGGGTAGLALATKLRQLGVSGVIVLEREPVAGGVPRHCGHYPFGLREFKRLLKGPDYAEKLVKNALAAGVDIRTDTTVTRLHPQARLSLSTPDGAYELKAERVVLCTGVRESSRAQRFIGGQRPLGVLTTGALQSMVFLNHKRPFRHPVILGTELVAFSALMTCSHIGIRPRAMLEENSRISARQFIRPFPALKGVPIRFGAQNIRILGDKTVEAVAYTDATGSEKAIEADGVIISGRFRPESALLSGSHLELDQNTRGPSIDQYGRASDPSYFCTGNILRPVETSGWCWQEAIETAARIAHDLEHPIGTTAGTRLLASDPAIRYVLPQRLVRSDAPLAMAQMQLRLSRPDSGYLSAISGGHTLWGDYLSSRPERRILAPLAPLLNAPPSPPVHMRILRH